MALLLASYTKLKINDIAAAPLQAFVVVGDENGHVGLGVKCAKEVGV